MSNENVLGKYLATYKKICGMADIPRGCPVYILEDDYPECEGHEYLSVKEETLVHKDVNETLSLGGNCFLIICDPTTKVKSHYKEKFPFQLMNEFSKNLIKKATEVMYFKALYVNNVHDALFSSQLYFSFGDKDYLNDFMKKFVVPNSSEEQKIKDYLKMSAYKAATQFTQAVIDVQNPQKRNKKGVMVRDVGVRPYKRVIFLDPESPRYRYPRTTPDVPGTQKSPHARRGHIRRLSEDKHVWVRPCWVGPKNVEYEGHIYVVRS